MFPLTNCMRRIAVFVLAIFFVSGVFAQVTDTAVVSRPIPLRNKANERSSDHFMLQLGHTSWIGKPDSINTSGFPRTINVYLMMDFPFKSNPRWSVAIGPGIATDNIFFKETYVGIKDITPTLQFQDLSDTSHFKKYKLVTAFLEAPVELRYRFNPEDDNKSVKIAVGAKVGTLLSAHVKGKDLQDENDNTILPYTQKEKSKRFFNKTRLSVMGRVGYGHFTLFASYAITPLFKEGFAPTIRPMTIGLTLSGL